MYRYTYLVIPTNENSRIFGNIYFGKHSTNNLNDGYIASGIKITDYLKKYPNDYYREIVKFYSSEEELNKAEYDLIHPHLGKDYCLNLREGGDTTCNYTLEVRQKMSKTRKERLANGQIIVWNKGKSLTEETKKKIGDAAKGREPWNKGKHNVQSKYWEGKQHSEDTKNKISESQKKRYLDPSNHIAPKNKGKKRVYDNKELNIYHYE